MKSVNLKARELVKILWSDSSFERGWHYPPYKFGAPERLISTVGYVVRNDSRVLTLTGSLSDTGGVLNPLFVPWAMIQKVASFDDELQK